MRLSALMIESGATLNSFKQTPTVKIAQGETLDLMFQLCDADQKNLRYSVASSATVFVEIPRFDEFLPTNLNQRDTVNYSIRRNAVVAFDGDRSIWKLALTQNETLNMASSSLRITVTEGASVKIALVPQAISVVRSEE